jgi:predicted Zn-dependent peptidase
VADQLEHAIDRMKLVVRSPDLPEREFERLRGQIVAGLVQELSSPGNVADRELDAAVYGSSPLGRDATVASLKRITLDDVRSFYRQTYSPRDAVLVFAGAIDQPRALELASKLLDGWQAGEHTPVGYELPPIPDKPRIILVDNPRGQQASIRVGIRAYTLSDEDRFAGSVAGQILSSGIDSRINRVLRAEKGLTYGAYGYFRPSRHGGAFEFNVDTKPATTGQAIASAFEVFDTMRREPVTADELAIAKRRVAGMMVLETQTVQQQAGRRIDTILNGYPIDYYDTYAQRIAEVEASQVREVMEKYVRNDRMTIVVVAPAAQVKDQLDTLGDVTVVEMPLSRE